MKIKIVDSKKDEKVFFPASKLLYGEYAVCSLDGIEVPVMMARSQKALIWLENGAITYGDFCEGYSVRRLLPSEKIEICP